jgi:hypothetical protein
MTKHSRQEEGVLTEQELAQVVDRFITEQQWRPGQRSIPLRELHQNFMDWLTREGVPFGVLRRKFCALMTERGFRSAYANVKSKKGGSTFRKIIFAEQGNPPGGQS